MPKLSADFDALIMESSHGSPEVALWLTVLVDVVITLRDGDGYQNMAREWIDKENPFFCAVADQIGYSPDGLRERIRESMERAERVRRRALQRMP